MNDYACGWCGARTDEGGKHLDGPCAATLPQLYREALERIAETQPRVLAMIERNGFVFDSIGREPGNWQHLAFSIYCELCEVDSLARAALDESGPQDIA